MHGLAATSLSLLPSPLLAAKSLSCPNITRLSAERRHYSPNELTKLSITLHPYMDRRKARHMSHLRMMEEGLRKHGLTPSYAHPNIPVDSDVAIGWSFNHHKMHTYRAHKGLNTLFLEAGFFQPRWEWVSMGWDGINNCGNFVMPAEKGKRWETYFPDHIHPWKQTQEGYILLMGQTPKDAALYGLNMNKWLDKVARNLSFHKKDILFRPHPDVKKSADRKKRPVILPTGTRLSIHNDLLIDLKGAAFSVTYSSTAAVESVLAGIPCITFHEGSIARPVTSQDITKPYFYPDRTKWCNETIWKQWTHEEIRRGDAWDVVKHYLLA